MASREIPSIVGHSNGKIIELNEGCFFPCLTPRAYADNILKSSRVRFQASDATGSIFAFSTFLTIFLTTLQPWLSPRQCS